jgi:hypothetical protein
MTKHIFLLGAAVSALWSNDGGVGGPVSGFVPDRGRSALRAIEGLPGAARLGARVRLPFAVSSAAISSRQDFALIVPAEGDARPALVRGLRAETPGVRAIEGVIEASSILLASSGTAALLYSAQSHKLQFVTGLPDEPRALEPVEAAVAAFALDANGSTAVLAGEDGQIYSASAGGPLRSVARLRGVSSISIVPGRDAAVAASGDTGEIVLIEGLAHVSSIRAIAGASEIPSPRAVQAFDARSVGVISGDGRLAAIDLDLGSIGWIALAGNAEQFYPLEPGLFALNRPGAHPLLLLDAAHGLSAWFVPPDRAPAIQRGPAKSNNGGEDRPY